MLLKNISILALLLVIPGIARSGPSNSQPLSPKITLSAPEKLKSRLEKSGLYRLANQTTIAEELGGKTLSLKEIHTIIDKHLNLSRDTKAKKKIVWILYQDFITDAYYSKPALFLSHSNAKL